MRLPASAQDLIAPPRAAKEIHMRKKLLMLTLLALCVCMLASCADFVRPMNEQNAIQKLDALQAQYEAQKYTVIRADEGEVASFAETLVSGEGIELKGAVVGVLEYTYTDRETGKMVMGVVIAVTDKKDAKTIGKLYESYEEDAGDVTVEVSVKGRLVEIVRS